MSRLCIALLLFLLPTEASTQDLLLNYMIKNWNEAERIETNEPVEREEFEVYEESEAYSWELGTPDNIPELIIIYQDSQYNNCDL